MKIETKYDIGQEVWTLVANRPYKCKVLSFKVDVSLAGVNVHYIIGKGVLRSEQELFPTKEELLKSL